jgi:uncharacterized protein (DUF4213/DUF364 family)
MPKYFYDTIREKFTGIIRENGFESEEVTVQATTLSPEEAIGNPEDRDYPLIIGRERMMQAEFKECYGQAFTDMYGNYSARLSDIADMELSNNFRRAIFISSLNAVARYIGLTNKTQHCKDTEPRQCSLELVRYIGKECGNPRIAMVGFQPRMIESLSQRFELRVTDMDERNICTEKFGITIGSPDDTEANLNWCNIALVTGTTAVNDTIDRFLNSKPVIFYGVTISGVVQILGLKHFCYYGH